ncbi:Bcr/CflA family multidrug efflux MFS transporter [Lederbergia citrea]|uniref:Bcr/CflA family multidrug efflux MFS transporter n=1 Tax=Lederbergia citrea TaxID=2833581 RepID=UPI001BC9E19E|nr:Bcr/CflA family multidrug efflux MFS transporter [Lederbergia citrea]MBS4179560.1 Bcr/CflA family multidrug efflux MFS transporter [Lederbergia citrea]
MNRLLENNRLKLALLLGMLAAMGPLTIDMYLPSFPTIASNYGTNASLVQFSLTACLLGLGVGQLIIGPMSDVRGRRKPLIIFLFLYFAASIACAFAPSIYVFIGARFMQGFTAAAGIVISRAVVRDMYSGRELTKFFALLMLINNLAPILAPVVGGGILRFTKWSGVFIVLASIGILLVILVTWKLKETLPPERRVPSNIGQTLKNFISLIQDRQFAGYALTQGFIVAGIFAYVSGTPFVYQNIYGASPQLFSLLFGMNGIGIMIGTQIVGRFSDRISETRFLNIGLFMASFASLALLIVVIFNGPLFAVVIPIFFFVSSIGIISTSSFSLAMESQAHVAGSAAALLGLLPFVLGSITAPLVGIAGEHTAVPMGAIIFFASMMALLSFYGLANKAIYSNRKVIQKTT